MADLANWLDPLSPTQFEVYWRSSYEETRAAVRREEKAAYYQENRDEIRARVNKRRRLAREAKRNGIRN